ncbi:MAG: N-acetylneuraminate synthase [Bacteroidetes bacterium]|jgi:sialic acid synthase SpsE|nr:N-acetylneuraminate synthase [Bacteroidota bacterium]
MSRNVTIGKTLIGDNTPTYFIADIAANHDGDFNRAKSLMRLAKEAGANAVKFQHHDVTKYVSDFGFKQLGQKFSHQSGWKKSIFQVYKDAEVPLNWTEGLKKYSEELKIDFFSTPYDLEMVDYLSEFVLAFKIGSGDLAWHAMLSKVAKTKKPVLLATGAGEISEVKNAMDLLLNENKQIILMQCNTNYTGDESNFKFIHLNVLKTYEVMYPDVILGLSDHTKGHETVLGAVSLGAKVIEKHFTDDTTRKGPDHPFSMDPETWREMVIATRKLELSLGSYVKEVQENELETYVLQRRAIRVIQDIREGTQLKIDHFQFQRPCPRDSISINAVNQLVGKLAASDIESGDYLRNEHIQW